MMKAVRFRGPLQPKSAFLLVLFSVLSAPLAAQELPANLGLGLRELVRIHRSRPAAMLRLDLTNKTVSMNAVNARPALISSRDGGIVSDASGRVRVTVLLDGTIPMAQIRRSLTALGGAVAAEDPSLPQMFTAFLPLDSAAALAGSPGVAAVKLSRKPVHYAGAVTSQGVQLIHSDQVNNGGITGQGITIGILSDSFDAVGASPQAMDDVATGDLPAMGVAEGRPGLKFLSDGPGPDLGGADEGRGLAQIAFDVAPGISLCFASADLGEISFAKNIRRLRTDPSCGADILVDDVQYLDEPMFSDGILAKAVEDVVTSDSLLGRKVAYFSAAGNLGQTGYSSDLRFLTDADARALTTPGINFSMISAGLDTSGGFHNFNPDRAGTPQIFQSVTIANATVANFVLQWDDPFDLTPSGITTDLNLLIFDANGRYLDSLSDNNFSTGEPIEIGGISDGTYRFAIARTGKGSHLATRVRYVVFLDGDIQGDYLTLQQPTTYGHSAARSAQSVGAYIFDTGANSSRFTPALESFSSAGPVTIAFDAGGNRLAAPEIRRKPDFSAPDCVNTTFFFDPDPNDDFFTFCGTSAAAPHAAGAAALLLQAAGGPGSLTNEQIRAKLQASPDPRDRDPFFSQAVLSSGAAKVTLTATGDDSNQSAFSTSFFRLSFQSATAGQMLTGLTIDLGPAGLNFDPSVTTGLPLTIGSSSAGIAVTSPPPNARAIVLNLTFSGFATAGVLAFGIDRDLASTNSGGNNADLLAGAKVTATLSSGTPASGVFANSIGTGYSVNDGFGLINVPAALKVP